MFETEFVPPNLKITFKDRPLLNITPPHLTYWRALEQWQKAEEEKLRREQEEKRRSQTAMFFLSRKKKPADQIKDGNWEMDWQRREMDSINREENKLQHIQNMMMRKSLNEKVNPFAVFVNFGRSEAKT